MAMYEAIHKANENVVQLYDRGKGDLRYYILVNGKRTVEASSLADAYREYNAALR